MRCPIASATLWSDGSVDRGESHFSGHALCILRYPSEAPRLKRLTQRASNVAMLALKRSIELAQALQIRVHVIAGKK